ncbi:MAG: hypothetical protein KDD10_00785 [Phaeodactylibacter sp.]|nr:hypothetical protein [Phaeodactylibacter sp.]MCB9294547.1 hypothetical protein [Lewinellaceae bacterium]
MKASTIIFVLSGFFLLCACDKGEAPLLDQLGPDVKVIAPKEGAELPGGENFRLVVEIEENLGLHSYYIWLVNERDGLPSLIEKQHLHTKKHRVDTTYLLPDEPGQAFHIRIEAVDHDDNRTIKSIGITAK